MNHHSLSLLERRILIVLLAAALFCAATILSSRAALVPAPAQNADPAIGMSAGSISAN